MSILKHLDKDNLHHAYLIEGAREQIVQEILEFFESIKVQTSSNPDFVQIFIDNFKVDEAFALRAMSYDKSFSDGKKIFIICANTFSPDAENIMLKMFEEPIRNTHFFLVVPDVNTLLKTLISRFYLIKSESYQNTKDAEKFIGMSLQERINFIKELLTNPEDEEGNEIVVFDSIRVQALQFLNSLELSLHRKMSRFNPDIKCFEHLFKVRKFLRMPGSSTKSLMESVALITPIL